MHLNVKNIILLIKNKNKQKSLQKTFFFYFNILKLFTLCGVIFYFFENKENFEQIDYINNFASFL